jgi:hypothetical protein
MITSTSSTANRNAIYSFIAAIFTVLAFCIGFLPIPLTALICYPVSAAFSIFALLKGIAALRQIEQSAEAGRTLALIGVWIGALTLTGVLCASTLFALALPPLLDFIQKAWSQVAH